MVGPKKAEISGPFLEPHDYKASKPQLDPLFSDEIDYLIRMIRMREIYAIELMLEPMGLGLSAWYPLAVLRVDDGMSQRELGIRLNLKDAAIGKAIDALEKIGLVERRKDVDDRRKALVFLTEEGRKAGRKIAKLRKQFRDVVVDGLSDAEQGQLKDLLERVYRNINKSVKI